MAYDYSTYAGFTELEGITDAEMLTDGVYRVGPEGRKLDVLLENFNGQPRIAKCLVVFSGAVYKRESKTGPFFSGRKISGKVDLPTVCISDPALELDDALSIGWYAGYKGRTSVREEVARVLDDIAARTGCVFMMIGGSAGGFAALSIAPLVKTESTVLVLTRKRQSPVTGQTTFRAT